MNEYIIISTSTHRTTKHPDEIQKKNMTLSDFFHYCNRKTPKVITYNDRDDIELAHLTGRTKHNASLNLVLTFDQIFGCIGTNIVCLTGEGGMMCISNVKCVRFIKSSPLGDIFTIFSDSGLGEIGYTLTIE